MKHNLLVLLITIASFSCKAQTSVLWGTTAFGGGRNGVIFNYNLSTHIMQTAYKFIDSTGYRSYTSLIKASNGLLYGTTPQSGNYDNGTIFSYNPTNSILKVLTSFPNGGIAGSSTGRLPQSALVQVSDSILLATTAGGGSLSYGTIISCNLLNDSIEYAYNFNSDVSSPDGSLYLANNGLLYGIASSGNIYSYNFNSHACIDVSTFPNFRPEGDLVETSGGTLYGISILGGSSNKGLIFKYDINGHTVANIHSFDTTSGCYGVYGWLSPGLLLLGDTIIYGVTPLGGLNHSGVLFSYSIPTDQYKVLHDFGFGSDGSFPVAPPTKASDGLLYGTTQTGGANGFGTLYSFAPITFTETVLHHFDSIDGLGPESKLLEIIDTATSIPAILPAPKLQISPNPSTGEFIIQLPGTQGDYPVEVYNTLGQKVEQLTLTKTQNTLNLTGQSAGIYFVEVQTETGKATGKIMVVK